MQHWHVFQQSNFYLNANMARRIQDVRTLYLVFGMMSILWSLNTIPIAGATNPPGFVYIDCGSSAAYVDPVTGIQWVPDDGFITTGVNDGNLIANSYSNFPELTTLRYFNESYPKDCYSLPVTPKAKYLLRASFYYGQYDNASTPPTFKMAIDATIVANVSTSSSSWTYEEFSITAQSNVTYLCLLRDSSNMVPFISAIALRPFISYDSDMDDILASPQYLSHIARLNFGGVGPVIRYPDDKFDRYWFPHNVDSLYVSATTKLTNLSTPHVVDTSGMNESIPSVVLQTCLAMSTLGNMTILSNRTKQNIQAYVEFYWAELDPNVNASSRQFWVQVPGYPDSNENVFSYSGGLYNYDAWSFSDASLTASTSTTPTPEFVLYPDRQSKFGPSLNALEIYGKTDLISLTTTKLEASAIEAVKSSMNLGKWSGDPCLPSPHSWLICDDISSPYILAVNLSGYQLNSTISPSFAQLVNLTSLDLSNCGLSGSLPDLSALKNLQKLHLQNNTFTGILPEWLASLSMLTELDLSNCGLSGSLTDLSALKNLQKLHLQNNTFTGILPEWLASLSMLTELFVENNGFSGKIPDKLEQRSNTSLDFRYMPGNPLLGNASTTISSSSTSSPKLGVIIGAVVGGIAALTIVLFLVLYFVCFHHRTNGNGHHPRMSKFPMPHFSKSKTLGTGGAKPYSLPEIVAATQNFKKEIGRGGFGPVYYGKLHDGQEVAIKVLDIASRQGSKEFFNEVDILSRVHHKNLVSLVGYCVDKDKQILIYEYISEGSLCDHLHGAFTSTSSPLDWKTRLNIALNAAQGLDYLHTGCNPSMIHRDVKSSNILLTNKMESAKVSDFGLSKLLDDEAATHVLTIVKGTTGYLDPEYFSTQQLSPKSDVYGFGVVLLELVTGRTPINAKAENRHETNVREWVRNSLESGNIEIILDPKLRQALSATLDSVWKVVDIAMQSVEPKSVHRPTMGEVVDELRQALAMTNVLPPTSHKVSHNYTSSNISTFSTDSCIESHTDLIPPR